MRYRHLTTLVSIHVLVSIGAGAAQAPVQGSIDLLRYGTIFLAEVQSSEVANGPAGSSWQTMHARVLVSKILRDKYRLGLVPGEISAVIQQPIPSIGVRSNPAWFNRPIQPGRRYVVFSDSKEGVQTMIEKPDAIEPVTPLSDVVGDIELSLAAAPLPVFDQASELAAALNAPQIRSALLAQHIAAILAVGPDSDTAYLEQSLEQREAQVFPGASREALLAYLAQFLGRSENPKQNLIRALIDVTVRCFIAEPQTANSGPTRLQRQILESGLVNILNSPPALQALREAINSREVQKRFKVNAAQCGSDSRLPPVLQARARQFLSLIGDEHR